MYGREPLERSPDHFLLLIQQQLIGSGRGFLRTFFSLEFLLCHELERNELPNPLLPDFVDAKIDGDPIDPRVQRGIKLKSLERPKHANEYFLAEVIYLFPAAQGKIDDVRDLALVAPDDLFERLLLASAEGLYELEIVGFLFHAELMINGYQIGKFLSSAPLELLMDPGKTLGQAEKESILRNSKADTQ